MRDVDLGDRCVEAVRGKKTEDARAGIFNLAVACHGGAEPEEIIRVIENLTRAPRLDFESCDDPQIESLCTNIIPLLKCPYRNVNVACLRLLKRLAREDSCVIRQLLARELLPILVENSLSDSESFALYLTVIRTIFTHFNISLSAIPSPLQIVERACESLKDVSMRKSAARALTVFIRGEMSDLLKETVLRSVKEILSDTSCIDFWKDVIFIPREFIRDKETAQFILYDMGFSTFFNDLMNSNDDLMKEAAITTIGRHYLYSNTKIDFPYQALGPCAMSNNESLSSSALWMLSNVIASSPEMIIEFPLTQVLLYAAENGSARSKMEAYLCVVAIVCNGNESQVRWCVENGCIEMFLTIIDTENAKWILDVLRALSRLFRHVDKEIRQLVIGKFEASDGPARINSLLESEDVAVAEAAALFCKTFHLW